jgi:hypothetical protein
LAISILIQSIAQHYFTLLIAVSSEGLGRQGSRMGEGTVLRNIILAGAYSGILCSVRYHILCLYAVRGCL